MSQRSKFATIKVDAADAAEFRQHAKANGMTIKGLFSRYKRLVLRQAAAGRRRKPARI